ncbi:unnamed protein product [Linum trigynum]|uniref:Uncharacterized protein n=1 Tax=Linum trigynum TaxID=586398 RepID=A0AAV2D2J2_9ROSI
MSVFKMDSDTYFIRDFVGQPTDLQVYDYTDQHTDFDMVRHSGSRWRQPTIVGLSTRAQFKALEVFGVTIGGDQLKELVKDLSFSNSAGQTFHFSVNRQGLCFLIVYSQPIVRLRINDRFGWSRYGVKPQLSSRAMLWSICDMSNGAVLVPVDQLQDGTAGGKSVMHSCWNKLVEEKNKVIEEKEKLMEKTESLLTKSLEEKEKEVVSLKAALESLGRSY